MSFIKKGILRLQPIYTDAFSHTVLILTSNKICHTALSITLVSRRHWQILMLVSIIREHGNILAEGLYMKEINYGLFKFYFSKLCIILPVFVR